MYKHVYDSLKYLYDKGGVIYLYADPHFSDYESYKFRGWDKKYFGEFLDIYNKKHKISDDILYSDDFYLGNEEFISEFMEYLDGIQIKNINSKCGKNDCLILLGDVGEPSRVAKLKAGYKVLLLGNHDKGASVYMRDYGKSHFEEVVLEEYGDGIKHYDYKKVIDVKDNHLFDEVYEGPLMINDRVILSHEPIMGLPNCLFNIHGHTHSNSIEDGYHMNVCMEAINGIPVNFTKLMHDGSIKHVESIHRTTIDKATARKEKKLAKNKK